MDREAYTILVINPGSTSTKLARYRLPVDDGDPEEIAAVSLPVAPENGQTVETQLASRQSPIREFLGDVESIDMIAARGGMVAPVPSGTYRVDETMLDHLVSGRFGSHPSNLGAPLAARLADEYGCPAIIADPVGVDEFPGVARYSGLEGIERKSFSHALNLLATARRASKAIGIGFDACRFVAVHLGGGISVAAIDGGRIVDVNNSNEGGPFTPQRSGSLPVLQLVDLCFSGRFADAEEVKHLLTRNGGLMSYLGTSDVREVLDRIDSGDEEAGRVLDAMLYQIAKEAAAMASVLEGRIHAVLLTGGFAREPVAMRLSPRLGWLGRIYVYPGEGEMDALAAAASRILRNEEPLRDYAATVQQ